MKLEELKEADEILLTEKKFSDKVMARADAKMKQKRSNVIFIVIQKGNENKFQSLPFEMFDRWSRKQKQEWHRVN